MKTSTKQYGMKWVVPMILVTFMASFTTVRAEEAVKVAPKSVRKMTINGKQIISKQPVLKAIEAIERREEVLPAPLDTSEKSVKERLSELKKKITVSEISDADLQAIAEEVQASGQGWENIVLGHLDRIEDGAYYDTMARAERMKQYIETIGNDDTQIQRLLAKAFGHLAMAESKINRARRIIADHDLPLLKVKAAVRPYLKDVGGEVKSANADLLSIARIMNGSK